MSDKQCSDHMNPNAANLDGTSAREHKAAPINGHDSGKAMPKERQGTK